MKMILSFSGLVLWAVFADAESASTSSVKSCGKYQMTGNLKCDESQHCTLTIFPKTQSETTIHLAPLTGRYSHLIGSTIKTEVQVTRREVHGLEGRILESVPLRTIPDLSRAAIQLIKSTKCI